MDFHNQQKVLQANQILHILYTALMLVQLNQILKQKLLKSYISPIVTEEKNIVYCNIGNRKFLLDAFYPKQKIPIKGLLS